MRLNGPVFMRALHAWVTRVVARLVLPQIGGQQQAPWPSIWGVRGLGRARRGCTNRKAHAGEQASHQATRDGNRTFLKNTLHFQPSRGKKRTNSRVRHEHVSKHSGILATNIGTLWERKRKEAIGYGDDVEHTDLPSCGFFLSISGLISSSLIALAGTLMIHSCSSRSGLLLAE